MKRFFKSLLYLLFTIVVVLVIFFFWASSSTLDKKDYSKLITNSYKANITDDSIYKVMTYNIGYLSGMTNNLAVAKPKTLFDKNLKKVITQINSLQPDIIAFQEIDYNSARSYQVNQQGEIAKMGYNYVAQAINWDKTYVPYPYWPPSMHFGRIVSGQSILSKYPLKDLKRIVLEKVKSDPFYRTALYLDRLAQVVTVQLDQKDVVLINVHLEAFDAPTRRNQMDAIIKLFEKYRRTNPTILLGDFNSDPKYKDAAIKKMFNLPNVGNACFSIQNYERTFDTDKPVERIDYIFYDKNTVEYIDGKVLTQFGQASDHFPVEMRFKLK